MKKRIAGACILLATPILGTVVFLAAQAWIKSQTLHAIGSATGANTTCQKVDFELLTGKVRLRDLTLSKDRPGLWEKVTVATVEGRLKWREWNSGILPLEVDLDGCSVKLQPIQNYSASEAIPPKPPNNEELGIRKKAIPGLPQIVLTTIIARNVAISSETTQPTIASGISCTVHRSINGWHGKLEAEQLGKAGGLLTKLKVEFAREGQGTRLADFRCDIKEGVISGHGWLTHDGFASLDFSIVGVQIDSIAPAWCASILSGEASGAFSYKGQAWDWKNGSMTGKFSLKDGAVHLGLTSRVLQAFLGADSDEIKLDSASAMLTTDREKWAITGLTLEKRDQFALTGDLSCDRNIKIKADLRLGTAAPLTGQNHREQTEAPQIPADPMKWTTLAFETTPQQLWSEVLAHLAASSSPENKQESNTPELKQNAKSAINAVVNFLSH